MARCDLDFYETPAYMTRALLAHVPEIRGTILEPCAGDLSIARILSAEGGLKVFTNDIDPNRPADHHANAADPDFATLMAPFVDWVVSNPPYEMPLCTHIVQNMIRTARVGVAMMLRLSFKEPTSKVNPRGPFLELHPITRELVMPRHSFTGNGKSDSVTTAWMIWSKVPLSGHPMLSLYRADVRYAKAQTPFFAEASA
jgi:hypothetical protein